MSLSDIGRATGLRKLRLLQQARQAYYRSSEEDQDQYERSPFEYVPKRTQEEEASGIASLHHGWHRRRLLIADIEVFR